jgi:sulfide:quinone oxidoreductase
VRTSAAEIAYDHLIVALGADLAPGAIPGLADASQTFFTFEGATQLRDTLKSFSGGRIALVVSAMPYKCPGAPHEGAMLIADYFRRRGLSSKVKIDLYTPESQPMPVAGPQLGEAVRGMLHAKGINFHPLHKLTSVDPGAREITFDNGLSVGYDVLVAVPPHLAPRAVVEAGLTNQAGWVPVNPQTLRTSQGGVYAIGDVTAIPIPGRWKPDVPLMLPKAGVFAHAQAEVVAQRIRVLHAGGRRGSGRVCVWQLLRRTSAKRATEADRKGLAPGQGAFRKMVAGSGRFPAVIDRLGSQSWRKTLRHTDHPLGSHFSKER